MTPNPTTRGRRTSGGPSTVLAWTSTRGDLARKPWTDTPGAPLVTAVSVDMTRRRITAPDDPTTLARTLRLHATIAARYGLTARQRRTMRAPLTETERNYTHAAEHLTTRVQAQRAANRVGMAHTYDDGTADPIAAHIYQVPPLTAYRYALPYLDADGHLPDAIYHALKDAHPSVAQLLEDRAADIANHAQRAAEYLTSTAPGSSARRYGVKHLRDLARTLAAVATAYQAAQDGHNTNSGQRPDDRTADLWATIDEIAAPPLVVANYARTGRTYIPRDAGRHLRHPSRALTDPARRVFSARGGQRYATVVADISGSMSLEPHHIAQLIEAARGCSVITYRTTNGRGIVQIVARDGRAIDPDRIRRPGGGNGIDGPALTWADRHLRRRGAPLVWISDGGITGRHEHSGAILARDMIRRLRETGAHQAENIPQAIALLDAMRAGHQPRPAISDYLTAQAND